jgi:hypothetical protein
MDTPEISPELQDAAQRAADELHKSANWNRTRNKTFDEYTERRIDFEQALKKAEKEYANAQKVPNA